MPIPQKKGPGGRPSTFLTDKVFDELLVKWNVEKMTSPALAKHYGVTTAAILSVVRRYPEHFEQRGPSGSAANANSMERLKEDEPEIAKLWRSGFTQEEIAKRVGVSRELMVKKTQEMIERGIIENRPRPSRYPKKRKSRAPVNSQRTPENLAIVQEMYPARAPFSEIVKRTGFSETGLRTWINGLIASGALERREPVVAKVDRPRSGFFKSQDRFDRLLHLWNVEHLTAAKCAERIGEGCTRNKVLGVILRNRDLFEARESIGGRNGKISDEERRERKRERVRRARAKAPPRDPKPKQEKVAGGSAKKLARRQMSLEPQPKAPSGYKGKTCQFPLWGHDEAPTHEYCGAVAVEGRSWCSYHMGVCFNLDAAA